MEKAAITYFDGAGPANTQAVLSCVLERLKKGDIREVVLASTTGQTALLFARALAGSGIKLAVVGEHAGHSHTTPDAQSFAPEAAQELAEKGCPLFIGPHAFSSIERGFSNRFHGVSTAEIVAWALRQFATDGVKVCAEIAVMAADAGLIPTTRDVIAVAGSGRGADTALVLRPAHMDRYLDLEIGEILCKPRRRKAGEAPV
nr:pyruvate kinase alpha/beta domain-containing protein [bacterium]